MKLDASLKLVQYLGSWSFMQALTIALYTYMLPLQATRLLRIRHGAVNACRAHAYWEMLQIVWRVHTPTACWQCKLGADKHHALWLRNLSGRDFTSHVNIEVWSCSRQAHAWDMLSWMPVFSIYGFSHTSWRFNMLACKLLQIVMW